jgi:hypothetical protein
MKRLLLSLLFLLLAMVVGCGGGRQSYAKVKGTVTFNTKPVEKGEVIFTVQGRPASVIEIVDGKFAGQAVIGENRVSISARKKSAKAPSFSPEVQHQRKVYKDMGKGNDPTPDADLATVDYIPPEWGTASKHTYAVEAGAPNEFEFNIKGPG